MTREVIFTVLLSLAAQCLCNLAIDRHAIVSRYSPTRNTSSTSTPMQVGNGNFAFGADITGLQTFQPYAILSSWGWKNDSLPPGKTLEQINSYHGTSWDNHGRLVQYEFGGNDSTIERWLIANPNRANLGRIGLLFKDTAGTVLDVSETDLTDTTQKLDIWTGVITSRFAFEEVLVTVYTTCAMDHDWVGVSVESDLLSDARLGVFIDYPWNDGASKFSAPFVGKFNMTSNHSTTLSGEAEITHTTVDSTYITTFSGAHLSVTRDSPDAHRYTISPLDSAGNTFSFAASFGIDRPEQTPSFADVEASSRLGWEGYWTESGFIDVATGSDDVRAEELQRRIVLSRYLMRVNEAGDTPPQESGLVNNGWYGKFHMEMYFWHSAHWALWNNMDILTRSTSVYSRFLPSSTTRAQTQQGWPSGARWPKMTDPSGRTAPGEINNLLIWQQPHPLVFAQYEYRAAQSNGGEREVLEKWEDIVKETADWMASFAWWNETTGVYDLGPPIYLVSEDSNPNATMNPAFELAYWRLGLEYAEDWMRALGKDVPEAWTSVKEGLAPLPTGNGTYKVYEGLKDDFWWDPEHTNDHPALVGLHGWLPITPGLDLDILETTVSKVAENWNLTNCWGWDFPMLAMSSARSGDVDRAINYLLDPLFGFDDVGMPVGGVRVPTPYFPGSGGLLYAVAMMAAGWDGDGATRNAPGFPIEGWNVRWEGLSRAI